jgi:formate hydrogenlyase transcriptional activator
LRALQEREIERLGGTRPIPVNVRLIAATNRDLAKMVAEKQFRSDLFYRLKVFPVFAPPLRERAADIPILVRHFVERHSRRMGKTIETIPPEAMAALVAWKWPGNIRELENFLERAVILSRGPVLHVPARRARIHGGRRRRRSRPSTPPSRPPSANIFCRALREAKGMIGGPTGAAERLGLKRTTLNSKIKKLGIERGDYDEKSSPDEISSPPLRHHTPLSVRRLASSIGISYLFSSICSLPLGRVARLVRAMHSLRRGAGRARQC